MHRSIQSKNGYVESEKNFGFIPSIYPIGIVTNLPVSLRRELEVRMNAYLPDAESVSGQCLACRIDDVIAEGDLDLARRRPEQG